MIRTVVFTISIIQLPQENLLDMDLMCSSKKKTKTKIMSLDLCSYAALSYLIFYDQCSIKTSCGNFEKVDPWWKCRPWAGIQLFISVFKFFLACISRDYRNLFALTVNKTSEKYLKIQIVGLLNKFLLLFFSVFKLCKK